MFGSSILLPTRTAAEEKTTVSFRGVLRELSAEAGLFGIAEKSVFLYLPGPRLE